jgi:hypothetical protein
MNYRNGWAVVQKSSSPTTASRNRYQRHCSPFLLSSWYQIYRYLSRLPPLSTNHSIENVINIYVSVGRWEMQLVGDGGLEAVSAAAALLLFAALTLEPAQTPLVGRLGRVGRHGRAG